MTWIICHVYHSEYTWTEIFCWYKACYCYCWFCHRFSSFNAEIIHATNGYDHWGTEYFCIILYISGYHCRKVSQSACDQCEAILMPLINHIHFCLRSNIWIFKVWGFCFTSKLNTINLVQMNEFWEIYLHTFYIGVTTEIKLLPSSKTLNHVQVVNVPR